MSVRAFAHTLGTAWLCLILVACSRPVDPAVLAGDETETPTTARATTTTARTPATDGPPPLPSVTWTPIYPTRAPVPAPTLDALRAVDVPLQVESYIVKPGDTLALIALQFGTTVEDLLALNHLTDPDLVAVGTLLQVPIVPDAEGPLRKLIPDSELVYGPETQTFDVQAFVRAHNGYLASYRETVEGRERTGAELVEFVARRFSVNPRLLLALLEWRSGWVTNAHPNETTFPLGSHQAFRAGLYRQLQWTADQLNYGFYGWRERGLATARLLDKRVLLADGLNAGSVGVQSFLAQENTWGVWQVELSEAGFSATYARFFGDPFAYSVEPLMPPDLVQPPLVLPWVAGETWYFTGGPHGGWADGSAWAALDFVPAQADYMCGPAPEWATALADGLIVRADDGQVVLDLDGDGAEGTGWTIHYSHLYYEGRVAAGTYVHTGDPLGHPSCEGGFSDATHTHIARRYNGVWLAAGGPYPFVLSGWTAASSGVEYDGTLQRGDDWRFSCECKEDTYNGLTP